MKKKDTIAFLRVRQSMNRNSGIAISANDRKTLAPLLDELKRRFWPGEED